MVRCWKRSENHLEDAQCTDGGPVAPPQFHFPHKVFWPSLSTALLLFILILGLTGHFGTSQPHTQSLQVVRFTAPDQTGAVTDQSAVVDQQNDLVIFSIATQANQTSSVLFDVREGLICYKPVNQESCFLQKMEKSDYDNVRSFLHESTRKAHFHLIANETLRQTEFLGVLGTSRVDMSTMVEPLQHLCQDRTVHWTKKTEGPGKQRLVYFCIDICFPSNICVSVCFYYLPE